MIKLIFIFEMEREIIDVQDPFVCDTFINILRISYIISYLNTITHTVQNGFFILFLQAF